MIEYRDVTVRFGAVAALPAFSLRIEQGEFFTLLGPSGCGKSTALRTLAGLIEPSEGSVLVDGQDVTRLPSHRRQLGMVFQNYALFPSMTAGENIAFGLRTAKVGKAEVADRVARIADEVGLTTAQLARGVAELSGGQQQRVAIARSLVLRPKILLLDEPLSNLDAKMRHQLRGQLKELQEQVGITTLYVTHDQDEALAMSDRLAVMNAGRVERVGTPEQVYAESSTPFVATFVGEVNVLGPKATAALGLSDSADGVATYLRAEMILTFSQIPSSRDLAATLALILGVATVLMITALNLLERRGTFFSVAKVPAALRKQRISNPVARVSVTAIAYLLGLVYALPPLLIVVFSFTDSVAISSGTVGWDSFTLRNYVAVLTDADAVWPILVSIGYSAAATVVVVVGILFVARMLGRCRGALATAVEYVLHLPWVLPSTLLALGLILAFDHANPTLFGAVLTGTVWLLGVAYVVVKIPFTLRMLKAAYAAVSPDLEDAAGLLGASPLRTFRKILLPLVAPAALAVAALNFNSLLDEYDAAAFLSHPLYQPLGLAIKSATDGETASDTTALSFVYSVLLMALSALTIWLVYGGGAGRLRRTVGVVTSAAGRAGRGRAPARRSAPTASPAPAASPGLTERPAPAGALPAGAAGEREPAR